MKRKTPSESQTDKLDLLIKSGNLFYNCAKNLYYCDIKNDFIKGKEIYNYIEREFIKRN